MVGKIWGKKTGQKASTNETKQFETEEVSKVARRRLLKSRETVERSAHHEKRFLEHSKNTFETASWGNGLRTASPLPHQQDEKGLPRKGKAVRECKSH